MGEQLTIQGELFHYDYFDEISSTSTIAKTYKRQDSQKDWLIISGSQTAGYGRFGREFYSPKHAGLYFTFTIPSHIKLTTEDCLPLLVSLAVAMEIEERTAQSTAIKWVNDVYINNKKVAGILAEQISLSLNNQALIIGVGINISPDEKESPPSNIRNKRGFVFKHSKKFNETMKKEWAISIVSRILNQINSKNKTHYLDIYREKCLTLNKLVAWSENEERLFGYAEKITTSGELIVRLPQGDFISLNHGDVSVLPCLEERRTI